MITQNNMEGFKTNEQLENLWKNRSESAMSLEDIDHYLANVQGAVDSCGEVQYDAAVWSDRKREIL